MIWETWKLLFFVLWIFFFWVKVSFQRVYQVLGRDRYALPCWGPSLALGIIVGLVFSTNVLMYSTVWAFGQSGFLHDPVIILSSSAHPGPLHTLYLFANDLTHTMTLTVTPFSVCSPGLLPVMSYLVLRCLCTFYRSPQLSTSPWLYFPSPTPDPTIHLCLSSLGHLSCTPHVKNLGVMDSPVSASPPLPRQLPCPLSIAVILPHPCSSHFFHAILIWFMAFSLNSRIL